MTRPTPRRAVRWYAAATPARPAPTTTISPVSGIPAFLPRRLEDRDPFVDRHTRDQLADDVEWEIIGALEADARLPHVELLSRLGEAVAQLLLVLSASVDRHQVQRVVILLRGEGGIPERLALGQLGISCDRNGIDEHTA